MEALFFSPAHTAWVAAVFTILGLLIGSFLNVLIHRMPVMEQRLLENFIAEESGKTPPHSDTYNLFAPRSACIKCGHKITALENIPVISYLFLRGKCSSCKTPISIRYPLIEICCGILSGALIWHFGSGWQGLAALFLTWILIACTAIDLDIQQLPDDLTLPLLWVGLLINLNATFTTLNSAVIGAAAGYLSLWSVNFLYRQLKGVDGMGYGDFKLLAALGAWFGWQLLPVIILISAGIGSIIGILYLFLRRLGIETKISFGPFLALAGMIALIWGTQISALLTPGLNG